jgi:hypothetical protein
MLLFRRRSRRRIGWVEPARSIIRTLPARRLPQADPLGLIPEIERRSPMARFRLVNLLKRRVDNDGRRVVHLARPDGTLEQVPVRDLVMGREVRTLPSDHPAGRPTALPSQRGNLAPQTELDLISEEDQQILHVRLAQVLEAENRLSPR